MVQDQAAYLEDLQSFLVEFDPECAPKEGTIIWYFWDGLWLLIKVKIEHHGQKLNSFKEKIEKIVDNKAKATFRPCFYAGKTNQHSFWDSRPSAIKASTQSLLIKDSKVEKPKKPQELKAKAPPRFTKNT